MAPSKKSSKKSSKRSRSRSPKGILRPVPIKGKLAEFMGKSSAPRTEVTKKIWEHIRRNKLQDGRMIHADKRLEDLIGMKTFSFLDIAKRTNKYFQ